MTTASGPKILFVTCSSFSGSTLLSFLLNTHPQMFTVGHTIGWRYGEDERFYCSCGEELENCPMFRRVAAAFADAGLPFAFRDFGTRFEAVGAERLNRYLTTRIPFVRHSAVEKVRDAVVGLNPWWAARLARQRQANRVFAQAALDYSGAEVYVDNTHNPYRLRHLGREPDLRLSVVYLVRDPRGVVFSHMKNHGWDLQFAIRSWMRQQLNIIRIKDEFDHTVTIHYEDLCDATDQTLAAVHRLVGLSPHPFQGSFTEGEHHILGSRICACRSSIWFAIPGA